MQTINSYLFLNQATFSEHRLCSSTLSVEVVQRSAMEAWREAAPGGRHLPSGSGWPLRPSRGETLTTSCVRGLWATAERRWMMV